MENILRRELKTWQRAFKARTGRDPTKRDILADPKIAGTYDTWQAVGGDVSSKPRSSRKVSEPPASTAARASSSRDRLDGPRTPSKHKPAVSAASPSKNPFRTPTKRSSSHRAPTSGGGNPFATPSRSRVVEQASPTGSVVDVEMTPKRSPLVAVAQRTQAFTPSKSPIRPPQQQQQYVTASPSKVRTEVAAASRLTPTKSPRRVDRDAALRHALVAYTPRTKARKRLRGEHVPPTPARAGGRVGRAGTDPRPAQRGLAAFGFASQRKASHPPAPTVTTHGAHTAMWDDDDEPGASPVKASARRSSGKPSFRPLFASPSSHGPVDVLTSGPRSEGGMVVEVEDAVMHDAGSVGGLFGAEVQRRRRLREGSDDSQTKKHKSRPTTLLPSSDVDDDLSLDHVLSSPVQRAASSPYTEVTQPSSATRPTSHKVASSPSVTVGWRQVREVELSDDDSPHKGSGGRKVINIQPYRLYGRNSQPSPPHDEDEEFTLFDPIRTSNLYAVHSPTTTVEDPDSALAGLHLEPVHQPPAKHSRHRVLANIFDPSSNPTRKPPSLNPEARFGPLHPHDSDSDDPSSPSAQADDDDDWLQEVDADYTFLDSEIDLADIA